MRSRIKKAAKECFSSKALSFEKKEGQYVVYQTSNLFWIPVKTKLISCEDIETLREINRRCDLGLKIKK
jgi:hypothetical protein